MKRLIINLLALIALLSVGVINFSAVTLAQDDPPPSLQDPFATGDDDDDDAPPALTLPDPDPAPAADPDPDPAPAADPDPEPAEADAPPALTLPAADDGGEEEAPAEELHGAAAPASGNAYSGGTTAKSGPGLAIIGLGSLLGAAALRRRKK
ncbi:hypothetical protein ACFL3T_03550 [Patescibacteria group bacterium]